MNTQYSQYLNEIRAAEQQQTLQREGASERAIRAAQHEQDAPNTSDRRPDRRPGLLHALRAQLRARHVRLG